MQNPLQDSYSLPETGFLRVREVLKHIPVSKSTWWAGVRSGRFPAKIIVGPGITVWRVEDIRALIEHLAAGE